MRERGYLHEDAARRVAGHILDSRAEENLSKSMRPVVAHNEQLGALLFQLSYDRLSCAPSAKQSDR